MREALHNRRFADTRFADKHRVIFTSAGQHLHHTADFIVAPDNRVKSAGECLLCELPAKPSEGLVFVLRVLIGYPLIAADVNECREDFVLGDTSIPKDFTGFTLFRFGAGDEEMFGADIFVLECRRLLHRVVQNGLECGRDIQFGTGAMHLRCLLNDSLDGRFNASGICPQFLKNGRDNPIGLRDECHHEMFNAEFRALRLARQTLRCLQCFLCLNRQSIKLHDVPP